MMRILKNTEREREGGSDRETEKTSIMISFINRTLRRILLG
jgi:hypothetical protein